MIGETPLKAAMDRVGNVLTSVEGVMSAAGYKRSDYRIVVHGYPAPIPAGDNIRVRDSYLKRGVKYGLPFRNIDGTWARNVMTPRVADSLRTVAAKHGADFLDFSEAFDGHEVGAKGVHFTGANAHADQPEKLEWMRFIVSGHVQGTQSESLHPNYWGQKAMGRCVGLNWAETQKTSEPIAMRCFNSKGQGPEGMFLHSLNQ
jgi:hypothetical protein